MTILERHLMDHLLLELEQSNRSFQHQLKSQFPRLTSYDIRLCTYLKANLSTKEIALLLNITPDSAKKAKHRLRKKLAIDPRQSISCSFNHTPD
ncbi:MAG: sigma-70 family RNA polymerase sigma factor [Roseivirga sp.]|nr:sigma-70 family RNA polymerase sigma factor [Roseivirga sp.]